MKPKYIIISVFMLAGLFACKTDRELPKIDLIEADDRLSISADDFEKLGIKLGSFESRKFPQTIRVNGMIDVPPQNKVIISAVRGGYIKSAPPIIGSSIEKGQFIISIENPEFIQLQQNYLETVQQLKYLGYEHERHIKMKAENVISEKSYRKSENEYKTAQAKYNGLKRQLELLNFSPESVEGGNISSSSNIYSPISGRISRVDVSKGSYISPQKEILEVVNTDHIHLELIVYEKDVLKIKKGQSIEFKIPESSQSTFNATVYLVNNVIDKNRTVQVHAHLDNEEVNSFIVGMFVEAEIETGNSEITAVPTKAIVDLEGSPRLIVLDEQDNDVYYFKSIDITVDQSHMDYTVVNGIVKESFKGQIVTNGAEALYKLSGY